MTWFDQAAYDVRLEWGAAGLEALRPVSDVIVIVDVLSFSTCVDVGAGRGALIFPFGEAGDAALSYAEQIGARCAGRRGEGGYSLSPRSFAVVEPGSRIVLPSPNGSALSLGTGRVTTLAGCLRNASAVAREAGRRGRRVAVIAAGERWPSGQIRPALEDLLGAGAIVSGLGGQRSPEAEAAQRIFEGTAARVRGALFDCASGRQLVEWGFADDVEMAAEWDASRCTPTLVDDAFRAASDGRE